MIYIYLFKGAIIVTIIVEQKLEIDTKALNEDINHFPQVHKITEDMKITHDGVSRLVMLDRYAFKDTEKRSEEHTSELQSRGHLVCRLLLEKKKEHEMK